MSEAITIGFNVATLLNLVTKDQLAEYAKTNPSEAKAINLALEAKAKADQDKIAKDEWIALLNTVELPPPPPNSDIVNVHNDFVTIYRPITPDEIAEVIKANPNINKDEVAKRMIPNGQDWKGWVVNKALVVPSTKTATTKESEGTRAITLKAIEGETVKRIGGFRTSKEACDYLGIEAKGDSAKRKLLDKGYIVAKYDELGYTVAK